MVQIKLADIKSFLSNKVAFVSKRLFSIFFFCFIQLGLFPQDPLVDRKGDTENLTDTIKKEKNSKSIYKPTIGIGAGRMSFFGDLYEKNFQSQLRI